jgi:hypothetical protein
VKDTIEDQRKCKEYKTFSGNIIIGLLSSHNVLPLKVLFIYLLLKRFQRRRHAFHHTKRIELLYLVQFLHAITIIGMCSYHDLFFPLYELRCNAILFIVNVLSCDCKNFHRLASVNKWLF